MAINQALDIQQQAANNALGQLQNTYNQTRSDLQPYRDMGQQGLVGLSGYANQVAGLNNQSNYDRVRNDPLYQFAQSEGQEMGRRALARQGMTNSRFGADTLSDLGFRTAQAEANNAYNRNFGQLNAINQNFGTLATLGQNAATNLANAGGQYARGYGDMLTGMANAQASGILATDAMNQQASADNNQMWANLAGTALGNVDKIAKGADWLGDTTGWW